MSPETTNIATCRVITSLLVRPVGVDYAASTTAQRNGAVPVFSRQSRTGLPDGRRYGVLVDTSRLLDALANFRLSTAELNDLCQRRVVDRPNLLK